MFDRADRRRFLASLRAVIGSGLGLFAAQAPAKADDDYGPDNWNSEHDDDAWDDWGD